MSDNPLIGNIYLVILKQEQISIFSHYLYLLWFLYDGTNILCEVSGFVALYHKS